MVGPLFRIGLSENSVWIVEREVLTIGLLFFKHELQLTKTCYFEGQNSLSEIVEHMFE